MTKILLAGEKSIILDGIRGLLEKIGEVHVTEPGYNTVRRMVKIVQPQVVFIVKTNAVNELLFQEMKELNSDAAIIVLCEAGDRNIAKYRNYGFMVLTKPITNAYIVESVEALVAGKAIEQVHSQTTEVQMAGNRGIIQAFHKEIKFATAENWPEQPVENPAKTYNILAIDDSPDVLRNIRYLLKDDYNISVAVSVVKSLEMIKKTQYDLILLDYEMPEIDGFNALKLFRGNPETADIPVVFLTGVADKERIVKLISLSPEGYLLKPIDANLLRTTINGIFEKRKG